MLKYESYVVLSHIQVHIDEIDEYLPFYKQIRLLKRSSKKYLLIKSEEQWWGGWFSLLERLIETICKVIGEKGMTLETAFLKDMEWFSLNI